MTDKLPTVAEFFAQYAENGYIFNPPLKIVLKSKLFDNAFIAVVTPSYLDECNPLHGGFYELGLGKSTHMIESWKINGEWLYHKGDKRRDIIAVLDDAGNVIAGEV
jgi:hypothetical protein